MWFTLLKVLVVNGQKFRVGCCIVYDVVSMEENPQFVNIQYILSVGGQWFVCGVLSTGLRFDSHLHAHIIDAEGDWFAFHPGQNIDYQCLSVYKCTKSSENVVIMRHKVCQRGIE
jgi:hypothetical protein